MPQHHMDAHQQDAARRRRRALSPFLHRVLTAGAVVVLALFLWKLRDAILLAFAGLLLAIFLNGIARAISGRSPLSYKWALSIVLVCILVLAGLGAWLLGPNIANQFNQLTQTIPQTFSDLQQQLRQYEWGQYFINQAAEPGSLFSGGEGNALSQVTGLASRALSFLAGAVLILFVGLFLAYNPGLYRSGILSLVPDRRRARAREVLDELGEALWLWLLGRFVAILFVFAATALGLWLIGVPLALALGLIAGILDFVPWVGPILAAIPGLLLAFTLGTTKVLYVALLYLVVQQLEGNLVTPLIQQHMVTLPPALVVLALTAFGLLFGVLGIIVAVPLAVVAMVLIKMLYIEDILGNRATLPGEEAEDHP